MQNYKNAVQSGTVSVVLVEGHIYERSYSGELKTTTTIWFLPVDIFSCQLCVFLISLSLLKYISTFVFRGIVMSFNSTMLRNS